MFNPFIGTLGELDEYKTQDYFDTFQTPLIGSKRGMIRTQMCPNLQQTKKCHYESSGCTFAHKKSELRFGWDPLTKDDLKIVTEGIAVDLQKFKESNFLRNGIGKDKFSKYYDLSFQEIGEGDFKELYPSYTYSLLLVEQDANFVEDSFTNWNLGMMSYNKNKNNFKKFPDWFPKEMTLEKFRQIFILQLNQKIVKEYFGATLCHEVYKYLKKLDQLNANQPINGTLIKKYDHALGVALTQINRTHESGDELSLQLIDTLNSFKLKLHKSIEDSKISDIDKEEINQPIEIAKKISNRVLEKISNADAVIAELLTSYDTIHGLKSDEQIAKETKFTVNIYRKGANSEGKS